MTIRQFGRYIAFSKEDEYGVAKTVNNYADTISLNAAFRPKRYESVGERYSATERIGEDRHAAGGSVEVMPNFITFGQWLVFNFGEPVSSTPGDGTAYTHIFQYDGQPKLHSWTIETYPDVNKLIYPGSVGIKARFGTSKRTHLAFGCEFMSADETDGGALPSISDALFGKPVSVIANGNNLGEARFSLSLFLDGLFYPGTGNFANEMSFKRRYVYPPNMLTPERIVDDGVCDVGGSLRWFYKASTKARYDAFRDLKTATFQASWIGPTIPGSANNYRLSVYINNAHITGRTPNWSSAGKNNLQLDCAFEGKYHEGHNGPFSVALTNNVSSYATY